MEEKTNAAAAAGGQTELKRVLGLGRLVCMGLAYLCPACILLYYGIVNEMTGGNFPIVLVIAGVAMTLTALSYAKMCREYPVAGSVYNYVSKSIGPKLGFISGWIMMVDYFILPMSCYLTCGLYLNIMFPAISTSVWIVISILFCGACNYFGVGISATINTVNVVAPIVTVILTVILIIVYVVGGGGYGSMAVPEAFVNPETLQFSTVMSGAALMCVVFVGFDSVTTYSEETINPRKTMPRAVVIICIGAAIEFIIMAYVMNCGWPWDQAVNEMADVNTCTTEYYDHIGVGTWMNPWFVVLNTLACIGCCVAGQGATTRILLAMGRDGFIPKKFFGYVHPKWQTPTRNILLCIATGFCALLFDNSLANAMSLVSFGAISGFILTNICVIAKFWVKDKKRGAKNAIQYLILPAIAAAVCIYLWFSLSAGAKIVGFSWLAVGIIFLAIKTKGFKQLPPEMNL